MDDTEWAQAVDTMKPYIFKVLTPYGRGTGFQLSISEETGLCGIATALHVVEHADDWEEPIKIEHFSSSKSILLKATDRAIAIHTGMDLAFIIFRNQDFPLQQVSIPLI